jgi:hypothetical protein
MESVISRSPPQVRPGLPLADFINHTLVGYILASSRQNGATADPVAISLLVCPGTRVPKLSSPGTTPDVLPRRPRQHHDPSMARIGCPERCRRLPTRERSHGSTASSGRQTGGAGAVSRDSPPAPTRTAPYTQASRRTRYGRGSGTPTAQRRWSAACYRRGVRSLRSPVRGIALAGCAELVSAWMIAALRGRHIGHPSPYQVTSVTGHSGRCRIRMVADGGLPRDDELERMSLAAERVAQSACQPPPPRG